MLQGKRALVTGSTSGIGLGIAKSLAAQGASLLMHGLGNEQEIESSCKNISDEFKVPVDFISGGDLSNIDSIEGFFQRAAKQCNGIDVLVNNAGIQHVAPVEDFSVENWDRIIAINLSAVFHTTRLCLPHMKQRNWGRIINVSSVHGLVGSVNKCAYVSAKHGVIGFSKVTALELAKTGITVNCICPGFVLTPLIEKQIQMKADENKTSFDEAKILLMAEKQPSGEFVTTKQLGDMAAFLCSDAADQVRGASFAMDGGWTAQ